MLFMKKKPRKAADHQREKLMELQLLRETAKKNIKSLRSEMQELVERAATADDLDRKILAMEYEEKEAALATETAHFTDICKLISQLNGVALVYERQKIFEQVASVADGIDTQELLRAGDMMEVRRNMMREESESLDDLLKESRVQVCEVKENVDFECKVREAQAQKLSAMAGGSMASPAMAAMEMAN